jgi:hypothetical protein
MSGPLLSSSLSFTKRKNLKNNCSLSPGALFMFLLLKASGFQGAHPYAILLDFGIFYNLCAE